MQGEKRRKMAFKKIKICTKDLEKRELGVGGERERKVVEIGLISWNVLLQKKKGGINHFHANGCPLQHYNANYFVSVSVPYCSRRVELWKNKLRHHLYQIYSSTEEHKTLQREPALTGTPPWKAAYSTSCCPSCYMLWRPFLISGGKGGIKIRPVSLLASGPFWKLSPHECIPFRRPWWPLAKKAQSWLIPSWVDSLVKDSIACFNERTWSYFGTAAVHQRQSFSAGGRRLNKCSKVTINDQNSHRDVDKARTHQCPPIQIT